MVALNGAALKGFALLLFLLVALGTSVPPVAAFHSGTVKSVALHIDESITLDPEQYAGYTFTIGSGDRLTYDIVVTSGTAIDMYIVPAQGLADYISESAQTFSLYAQSEIQTTISGTFVGTSSNSGADTVIVDNAQLSFSGANPTGPVTVAVNLTRTLPQGPDLAVVGGILLVVIIVIALIAVLALRARRKRAAMPPPMAPPPYPGPPGPYAPPPYTPPQQPPQGPYPPPPSR